MKKVILVLMILTAITTNQIIAQQIGTLPFVSKWEGIFHTWSDPTDPVMIAADLTTIKNFINTNGTNVGGNNAFLGANTFAGSSTFNAATSFTSTNSFSGATSVTSPLTTSSQLIYTYIADTATVNRTLKGYEVITTSINATNSAGRAYTLPLGTSIDTALGLPATGAGIVIDFELNNIAGTGNDSLLPNTGVTFGTIPALYNVYATQTISTLVVAGQTSHFELFRSAAGVYKLYRRD